MPYEEEHANPQGPGDARPTAMQIVEDEGLKGKLNDRVVIITGASSGIGVENARALYTSGATVYMPVRNLEKGQKVAEEIKETKTDSPGRLEVMQMDLDSLDSVKAFAQAFLEKESKLNLLITNAGIMACPESTTKDGFEAQFGTNHVAHFLLFELLRPLLLSSSTPELNSRVVTLSSVGHRSAPVFFDDLDLKKQGYSPWVAYGQSKTANILMAVEIERRYGPEGLHATAVMPGGILTGLQIHVGDDMLKRWEQPEIKKFMKNTEQGAATTMWAAVGKDWEGKGGKYLDNCAVPGEAPQDSQMMDPGYRTWAMDPEAAEKLWEVSLELTKPWREDA
eukprot:jgi/Ulvmu1/11404/UM075_0066.1